MLMLLFNVGNERYAIASQKVVEVIPLVLLKTLPHTPPHIAGVFNYRGRIVPVIDVCQLMEGKPCGDNLSTRIILTNYCRDNHTQHILGLMAEQVVETLHKSASEFIDSRIQIETAPYLGQMILDEKGMIQCVQIEYLLSEAEQVNFLAENFLNPAI
ncbi:purine-binding chemotaxis protein CheW [Nostoc sp. LEGE 06077]|uniref:chemotaxis protein CheW n=1 Tax=Nostoc sp. LEGE 06077 TaxID=915325 RepID=UPI00187F168D|nr:chemotaxis protein CheW [Nostoc sp. LEGE 06077]MBE9208295.1 purine-binding chemotaxis protein CheW [Nostoc sp. LEGE 06077]